MRTSSLRVLVVLMLAACSPTGGTTGEAMRLRTQDVRALYASYEAALRARRGDTIAAFYHPAGARLIGNGSVQNLTNAGIDSIYRGAWTGPAYFSFDDLDFEQLSASQVVVTGGFRWVAPESTDTARFIYLSIVEQTEVGPRIRLEHETARPRATIGAVDSTEAR